MEKPNFPIVNNQQTIANLNNLVLKNTSIAPTMSIKDNVSTRNALLVNQKIK